MTDVTTRKPLAVSGLGTDWPYIRLPLTRLDEIREILDRNRIMYSTSEHAISLDGGPYIARITLDRGTDPGAVQALLDVAD